MPPENNGSSLTLNISHVIFENAPVRVGIIPYLDEEQFNALRDNNLQTHVIRRHRNEITCVPIVANEEPLGKAITIPLRSNPHICAALVRTALLNFLYKIKRPSSGHAPVKFMVGKNLLNEALNTTDCPAWLSVYSRYIIDPRVISFDGTGPVVGIVVDAETTRRIEKPCSELLAEGFSLEELYVGTLSKQDDYRLDLRLSLAGCVSSVAGNRLLLRDARSDVLDLLLSEARLAAFPEAFERCLQHAYKGRTDYVKAALERHLIADRTGPNRLKKIGSGIQRLTECKLEIIPGVSITFEPLISQNNSRSFPSVRSAPKPVYVFDPSGSRTDTWNDRGLNQHGPYTINYFTPSRPRICVICQKNQKGSVGQFLHKFQEGIQSSGGKRAYYDKGFVRKYALDGMTFEFYTADDASPEAYHRAASHAVQQGGQRDKWDMAFIQIEERFHQLEGGANPYLVAKAAFLMHQIPTQAFESETMAYFDGQLGPVLNNMALAVYAKLNGIPWLIKANPTIAQEFVVGIGSALVGEGRLGKRDRVVGITTVFKGDGNYFLSNLSNAVPMENYQETLLQSLRMTIDRVRKDMNWQPRQNVRLVFHAFKPMKDTEADAVRELMEELGDYDVDYAFLHIKENHPYVLFDTDQKGMPHYLTKEIIGAMVPERGLYFPLSERETLLTLAGPRELKKPSDGMPRPILLSLHRNSNFEEMKYLTHQVYAFSCHSWRSFFPATIPVTILYSRLVADLLGQLEKVPRWSSDAMLGQIGTTRWFL